MATKLISGTATGTTKLVYDTGPTINTPSRDMLIGSMLNLSMQGKPREIINSNNSILKTQQSFLINNSTKSINNSLPSDSNRITWVSYVMICLSLLLFEGLLRLESKITITTSMHNISIKNNSTEYLTKRICKGQVASIIWGQSTRTLHTRWGPNTCNNQALQGRLL